MCVYLCVWPGSLCFPPAVSFKLFVAAHSSGSKQHRTVPHLSNCRPITRSGWIRCDPAQRNRYGFYSIIPDGIANQTGSRGPSTSTLRSGLAPKLTGPRHFCFRWAPSQIHGVHLSGFWKQFCSCLSGGVRFLVWKPLCCSVNVWHKNKGHGHKLPLLFILLPWGTPWSLSRKMSRPKQEVRENLAAGANGFISCVSGPRRNPEPGPWSRHGGKRSFLLTGRNLAQDLFKYTQKNRMLQEKEK